MSAVPKCLLWQNVDSQNVYLAKMSIVPKCPFPKCLLSNLNPEGPFGKEISLIYKEFSRHFGILLKTLQPVLTVYNEFVFFGKCMIPIVCFLTAKTTCMKVYIHKPNEVKNVTSLVKDILGVDIFAQ